MFCTELGLVTVSYRWALRHVGMPAWKFKKVGLNRAEGDSIPGRCMCEQRCSHWATEKVLV